MSQVGLQFFAECFALDRLFPWVVTDSSRLTFVEKWSPIIPPTTVVYFWDRRDERIAWSLWKCISHLCSIRPFADVDWLHNILCRLRSGTHSVGFGFASECAERYRLLIENRFRKQRTTPFQIRRLCNEDWPLEIERDNDRLVSLADSFWGADVKRTSSFDFERVPTFTTSMFPGYAWNTVDTASLNEHNATMPELRTIPFLFSGKPEVDEANWCTLDYTWEKRRSAIDCVVIAGWTVSSTSKEDWWHDWMALIVDRKPRNGNLCSDMNVQSSCQFKARNQETNVKAI
jgi:hypothetical protein